MMNYKNLIIAVMGALLFTFSSQLFAQDNEWKLVSDQNDIKVFTRHSEGSDFKEVRVKTIIDSPVEILMATLGDVENYTNWVYKCKTSYKLKTNKENGYVYYSETQMPPMINNRDLVVHSRQWIDEATGITYSVSKAALEEKPIENGIIRIEEFESKWKIEPLDATRTAVDYVICTNPGGNLPAWLVNMGITVGPTQTMKNLKEVIAKKNKQFYALKTKK